MYVSQGLKSKLLEHLKVHGTLSRTEMREIAKKGKYEHSNAERRLREIGEDYPVVTLNRKGQRCKLSDWIAAWKWIGSKTVFNKK